MGAIKNGVRVALLYKDEHFYGIKPDVSINVPFYAVGYAHNPKENIKDKVYSSLASKAQQSLRQALLQMPKTEQRRRKHPRLGHYQPHARGMHPN